MRTIELSRGYVAKVDDADFANVSPFCWFAWTPSGSPQLTYAVRKVRKADGRYTKRMMHREIMLASRKQQIDHENHDGTDNQRHNLRFSTQTQNLGNSRKIRTDTTSRFKGVTWSKACKKWQVSIQHEKKRRYLGYFSDEILAAKTYNKAAKFYFGEFAHVNNA